MNERDRLQAHRQGEPWLQWGPYLSERQWGTVREDYSPDGNSWRYLPHDHARSRAYRWGEDGLAGFSDDQQRLCLALALWNGHDPILKERLFGLDNHEGNHGEDVKEIYHYLEGTPTHSYQRMLYKYPHAAFPYELLRSKNRSLGQKKPEFELLDTGVLDDDRYFDVEVEYAKASPRDVLMRVTVHNRGRAAASLHLLPTLWFRNQWSPGEGPKAHIERLPGGASAVRAFHPELGAYTLHFQATDRVLFTENETNTERLEGKPNATGPLVKDAFHDAVITGHEEACRAAPGGTKCAPVYRLDLGPGESAEVRLRLTSRDEVRDALGAGFTAVFDDRRGETDEFYAPLLAGVDPELATVQRQAWAGLLWSKQFYHYDVARWLDGDPGQEVSARRKEGRNHEWRNVKAADIMLMPDKWEYPWFGAWDLAFHALALAPVDLAFAKQQCLLLTSTSRYTVDGRIPTHEFDFSTGNPAVRGQAVWWLFEFEKRTTGQTDRSFLREAFTQLTPNYRYWLKRTRQQSKGDFEGSFLGLDNVSLFNREEVPGGAHIQQADGQAWMGSFGIYMMRIALELAAEEPAYEDRAIELFHDFVEVSGTLAEMATAWAHDRELRESGFHFDLLVEKSGHRRPIPLRSVVGVMPLLAQLVLERKLVERLPRFRQTIADHLTSESAAPRYPVVMLSADESKWLFAMLPRQKVDQLLPHLFDEKEMLAPGGIRSMSKAHTEPVTMKVDGKTFTARYEPGEADGDVLGGNSNWRGPVWFPLNALLLLSLHQLVEFYGDELSVELPRRTGPRVPLRRAVHGLTRRLQGVFRRDADGRRPMFGAEPRHDDPHFRDHLLFYEYFDGDTSRGCGASHQTGWTALVTVLEFFGPRAIAE